MQRSMFERWSLAVNGIQYIVNDNVINLHEEIIITNFSYIDFFSNARKGIRNQ